MELFWWPIHFNTLSAT